MSGRSGFRKSHHPALGRFGKRRDPITPPDEMPDWCLSYPVPGALQLKVTPGMDTGFLGVRVLPGPAVHVNGKNREWVLEQGAKFFAKLARGHGDLSAIASMSRADEEPPTPGAPPRRGYSGIYDVIYTAGAAVVLVRPYDRPMIYPAGR